MSDEMAVLWSVSALLVMAVSARLAHVRATREAMRACAHLCRVEATRAACDDDADAERGAEACYLAIEAALEGASE